MSTTLLQTKLYIPRRRPSLIARPRLIDKLNQGLNKELTLISAPAGFGKTTLVIEWLQQCDLPAAWLALDEGDNDPVRFWAYVTAALNQIGIPHLEVDRSASPSANMAAMENVVTAVINEITTIPSDFLFVLDDYHLISEQAVHQALSFLIEHMPAQMHLVIATRSDLPFPVARLRARSALNELRQKDLQFTIEEAAFYFNQLTGLDLETAAIETLTRRTEGWISGLHMAAVSIERHKDPDRFIQAFAGSDRYIADYLIEEVLNQQPAHIQEFLLKTAVLQRFTTALCAAVTQSQPAKSQEILDELERANLFVTALDNRRQWYRYHRLFADLLLQILHQTYPGLALDLHRRASMWYEEQSLNAEAIEHAFACSDYERAAHLIEEVAESTFDRSETVTLQGWCAALPSEILQDHLCLLFYYTWSLMQSGRAQDKVEDYLEQLDRRGYIPGRVTALRALSIAFQDQIDQALEISRLALEQLAADDPFLRYAAAWNDNFSYRIDGDLSANMQALATSARKGSVAGNVTVAVGSLCQLARLLGRQGKLQQAKIQYEMALTQAVDGQKRPLPIAGLALIGLGELHLEWNELEEAANYLSKGIQIGQTMAESCGSFRLCFSCAAAAGTER